MALISNIHYNLSAWVSGPFTQGQRCSSGGNAYKCITAGSSTAAPTGSGNSINNGGSAVFAYLSSIDYTALQDWANALPATLTQAVVAQVWNNGPITTASGTVVLSLTGHATTPTNNITVTSAPADAFNAPSADPFSPGYSSGYGSVTTGASSGALAFNQAARTCFILPATGVGGVNYFSISDANVVVSNLQFQDPNPSSGSTILQANATCSIQNCIFDGYSQTGGASILDFYLTGAATSVVTVTNTLVVDRCPAGGSTALYTIGTAYNAVFANNTFVAINSPTNLACIVDSAANTGTTINIINDIVLGYGSSAGVLYTNNTANTAIAVSYSLFGVASLTGGGVTAGSGNLYLKTLAATFVSATTNFRPSSSSPAVNAGTNDTTDIPVATDIFNYARPSGKWTIGAAQLVIPVSVGSFSGQASFFGSFSRNAVGSFSGSATFNGVSKQAPNVGVGSFSGVGSLTGAPLAAAIGSFSGIATLQGYGSQSAINASITLTNPGNQVVNTPFPVTGTYTLTPNLQFANDSSVTFTPIPSSGVTALGTNTFTFTHPGITTAGQDTLLVEDLVTSASAAANYVVTNTPPPPPPPVTAPIVTGAPFAGGANLSSLPTILPAYIYQQYADDDNINAFAAAYNNIAQAYLDWFNGINLPVWTGAALTGPLLDWVATGIYGIPRPVLSISTIVNAIGDFNTYDLNTIDFDGSGTVSAASNFIVTDDIYKRILTWYLYKGDGFNFNVLWLKRRVARFLAGVNGTDYTGPTDQISVAFTGTNTVNITLNTGAIPLTSAQILQACVLTGSVPLPFQYNFTVLIN